MWISPWWLVIWPALLLHRLLNWKLRQMWSWSYFSRIDSRLSTLCHGWRRPDCADICQQDAFLEPPIQRELRTPGLKHHSVIFCSTTFESSWPVGQAIHDVHTLLWKPIHSIFLDRFAWFIICNRKFNQKLCWEAWAQTEGCIHRGLAAYVIRRYNKTRNCRPDSHLSYYWSIILIRSIHAWES